MSDSPAKRAAIRILKGLPLALLAPFLLLIAAVAIILTDLVAKLLPKKLPASNKPNTSAASIVIPNWNGRDLLEKYLPSVVTAAERVPGSEVIVVDNGSSDGSAEFVRQNFPQVKLLALAENLGFGGGSNAGFAAAKHDIVVLLNSDMRVEVDFLPPLLAGFTDELVFSVSCQIFFSDSKRIREETGLTETWWAQGALRVRHRADDKITGLYPCSYGGGGSCAYDRRKFHEIGGFDELLRPFYLEDTDLGYLAWKRGWKTMYQPASVVYHEHRGTIGKKFSQQYIQGVLKKNFLLFTWKNIHEGKRLLGHFAFTWASTTINWIFGDSPERSSYAGIARAVWQLPGALHSRTRAIRMAAISDTEAFRRPLGGHFRDTFDIIPANPDPLRVLFVSPYPICPPTHGGGVFMYQTVNRLAKLCELHTIVMLDYDHQRPAHDELDRLCASTDYFVRLEGKQKALGSIEPHAVREFSNHNVAWSIHRAIYTHKIDIVQLEYTPMAQYAFGLRRIPTILFEHDVYFQSIARRLPLMKGLIERIEARWEYLRAIRYELRALPKVNRVQVCSRENGDYLLSFLPQLKGRIDDGFRAGIDTSLYNFKSGPREPLTMLFLGSFRHPPNQEAVDWFARQVLPHVLREEPDAKLIVIGSDPPPRHSLPGADAIQLVGFVDDIRDALAQYALFVCPILSGSGVRVKLLEAYAAGIPVVSTRIGAEGLADVDGDISALADDPQDFAGHVVDLLRNPKKAEAMAERARQYVVSKRDMQTMTKQMLECYRDEVAKARDASN
ncbi:MAG: glycosyltransferase [Bryobacteraceae bacterium]